MLKFFGLCILVTRFEFGSRRELWSMARPSKYIPSPVLGKTGMPRNRFDDIFTSLRFSHQPETRPPDTSSEAYRWMLIDDHVKSYNRCRANFFVPSHEICCDESMSRWYGMGGDWINAGLPHYVAIDRKPENGCEIQNLADGESGIMLQLAVVKSKRFRDRYETEDENMTHGCWVSHTL